MRLVSLGKDCSRLACCFWCGRNATVRQYESDSADSPIRYGDAERRMTPEVIVAALGTVGVLLLVWWKG